MRIATIATAAILILAAPQALAHEGHAHHVMGVVKAVDANHVEIETKDAGTVSVVLDKETKYLRDKKSVTNTDIKVGDRIAIMFMEKDGKKMAHEVQLGTSLAHTQHASKEAHEHP